MSKWTLFFEKNTIYPLNAAPNKLEIGNLSNIKGEHKYLNKLTCTKTPISAYWPTFLFGVVQCQLPKWRQLWPVTHVPRRSLKQWFYMWVHFPYWVFCIVTIYGLLFLRNFAIYGFFGVSPIFLDNIYYILTLIKVISCILFFFNWFCHPERR